MNLFHTVFETLMKNLDEKYTLNVNDSETLKGKHPIP